MNVTLFPHASMLCWYAESGRLPELRSMLDGQGRWTAGTAHEIRRGVERLPALSELTQAASWLGEPIEICDASEIHHVHVMRRAAFGGDAHDSFCRLGEAETFHVLCHWPDFVGGVWLTDDVHLQRFAHRRGVRTSDSVGMERDASKHGRV